MKNFGSPAALAGLLAFNGGFVDTAGFLGLQGLFTAHVTGNFVTLGAALVEGSHGIVGKLLALPEFILVVALARLAGTALRRRGAPVLPTLLVVQVLLLGAFFGLAVAFGPFPNADSPAALLTGFAGIAAMAVQNAVHRVHLADQPPSTLMTGSTTQATIDLVDIIVGGALPNDAAARTRLRRLSASILYFAAGCAVSALLYWKIGFWGLAVPVVVGALAAIMRLKPES
ncbi:MAG TPA: YoaK family protein [Pseudolabrys sp.]|nr:YoaK family protein [Pseudolabrys sp.]